MGAYEDKLDVFAKGKQLVRLPRPLRDRADALCDACGSTQPRLLYGLRDATTDRRFFVGQNCLVELTRRGVVLRHYGKEPAPKAYEQEMQQRREETVQKQGIVQEPADVGEDAQATQKGKADNVPIVV